MWLSGLQVENEFGSYGDVSTNPADKQYMEHLVSVARTQLGNNLVLCVAFRRGARGPPP